MTKQIEDMEYTHRPVMGVVPISGNEDKMRRWLESEVKAAEQRWEAQKRTGTVIGHISHARGYWEALSAALDTFEAISEGKQ